MTAEGERLTCSLSRNRVLFDAVRGTHGQIALIVAATIPLQTAPSAMRVTQAGYDDASVMMRDLKDALRERRGELVHALAGPRNREVLTTRLNSKEVLQVDADAVARVLADKRSPWVYQLEVADPIWSDQSGHNPEASTPGSVPGLRDSWEMPFADFVFRIPPLIAEEARRGAAPHPELILWVPEHATEPVIVDAFAELDPMDDIGGGPVLLFGLRQSQVTAPFYALPTCSDLSIFFGLLRRAEPATRERVEALRLDNENRYAEARAYGAGRYVCDTPPSQRQLADVFWPQHFAERWEPLCELKRTYDPHGIFRSSWGASVPRGEYG